MIVNPQNLRGIYVGFNTLFNKALNTVEPLYKQIATVTPSTTDAETYAWLGDIPGMREWIGDREIQNLAASGYVIKNRDFELTVGIDRNAIEDDKISLYNPSIEMLAQSAAMHPDELVFALLASGFSAKCYDGKPFFSGAHQVGKNTVSNKGTAQLSLEAYIAARAGMMSPGHPRRRLHQRQQEHDAGHREAPRRPPARRARLRVVLALHLPPPQAPHLPGAEEGEVREQDRRDRRQRLHEEAVPLRRGQPGERGLRVLADGLRQRRQRQGVSPT